MKQEIEFHSSHYGISTVFVNGSFETRVSTFKINRALKFVSQKLADKHTEGSTVFKVTKKELQAILNNLK